MTLIKRVGRYLAEITISWSFEIVTCYWGRWVFEEEVTISKQTFRFVLYPLRRIRGKQFCNMPHFLLETFPKVLSIKSWSSSLHFTSWNILSKTLLFRNMSLFLRGGWVVKFLTLSHFCHMSLLGGGGWVLKEIWSMSLNNPFFFFVPFPNSFLLFKVEDSGLNMM